MQNIIRKGGTMKAAVVTKDHHVEILDDVVGLVPLRQPVVAPVVLFLRGIAVEKMCIRDSGMPA